MKLRVSIALATFNGEKHLAEQLHSFAAQTYLPDELVVCDDCSNDSTVRVVQEFSAKVKFDVRIFVNRSTIGYARNFSKALEHCTGDLVFLSDQDDVWLPAKIEEMVNLFSVKQNTQLLIHDIEYCKEDLSPLGQTKIERMRTAYDLDQCYVVGMATAVRGPFLKLCLPIPIANDLSHDLWLHNCARSIGKKDIIPKVLAMYRRHPSSATNAGILNVDYIFTPCHLSLRSIQSKTSLYLEHRSLMYDWLQSNMFSLVNNGYVSQCQYNQIIEVEKYRNMCMVSRKKILEMNRYKRIIYVIVFYLRGGYRFFSGLKSAAKDILYN